MHESCQTFIFSFSILGYFIDSCANCTVQILNYNSFLHLNSIMYFCYVTGATKSHDSFLQPSLFQMKVEYRWLPLNKGVHLDSFWLQKTLHKIPTDCGYCKPTLTFVFLAEVDTVEGDLVINMNLPLAGLGGGLFKAKRTVFKIYICFNILLY